MNLSSHGDLYLAVAIAHACLNPPVPDLTDVWDLNLQWSAWLYCKRFVNLLQKCTHTIPDSNLLYLFYSFWALRSTVNYHRIFYQLLCFNLPQFCFGDALKSCCCRCFDDDVDSNHACHATILHYYRLLPFLYCTVQPPLPECERVPCTARSSLCCSVLYSISAVYHNIGRNYGAHFAFSDSEYSTALYR